MQIISIIADLLTIIVFFVSGIAWIIGKLKFLQDYPLISQISLGLLCLVLVIIMIKVVIKHIIEVVYSLGLAEQKRQLSAASYLIEHSKPINYSKIIPKEIVLREFSNYVIQQGKKFSSDVEISHFRYWSSIEKSGNISQSAEVTLHSQEKNISYTYHTDDFSLEKIKKTYPTNMTHAVQFSRSTPFYDITHWRDAIIRSIKHSEYDHAGNNYYLNVMNMGGSGEAEIHITISLRNLRIGKSHSYVLKNNRIECRDGTDITLIHEYK